jgi:acyl-CoA thioester hydrolase
MSSMSRVHHASFTVRFDECDAYGLINNPNLVRYMSEAGRQADRAHGWMDAPADGGELAWAVARMEVAFLRPAHDADQLEVSTWVSAVQADGWQRVFDVRRNGESDLLAKGRIEQRVVDGGGRPQALPEAVRAALGQVTEGAQPTWELSRPSAGTSPVKALSRTRPVTWRDVDPRGWVNIAAMLDYMTDAGIDAGVAFGWTLARCQAEGLAFVVREHGVDCRGLVGLGEVLDVTTWLSDVRRSTGLRHYRLRRGAGGVVVAEGHTRWVVVDPASMRPARLPDSFTTEFAGHISA